MPTQDFQFRNQAGQTLDGRLEAPAGALVGTALFAHCFTCTKQSLAASNVSRALAARGWRTLRFDFTGLGDSEGQFARGGLAGDVGDIVAAAGELAARQMPVDLLIGHSFGGAAVIAAAGAIDSVRALATIGAPFHVEHVLERLGDGLAEVERRGEARVTIGGRAFTVSRDFIAGVLDQPQGERLASLGRALLVMHSPTDDVVGIDNAKAIFEAARHPKSFVALDGADHLLTRSEDADDAAAIIAAWARRYAR